VSGLSHEKKEGTGHCLESGGHRKNAVHPQKTRKGSFKQLINPGGEKGGRTRNIKRANLAETKSNRDTVGGRGWVSPKALGGGEQGPIHLHSRRL